MYEKVVDFPITELCIMDSDSIMEATVVELNEVREHLEDSGDKFGIALLEDLAASLACLFPVLNAKMYMMCKYGRKHTYDEGKD